MGTPAEGGNARNTERRLNVFKWRKCVKEKSPIKAKIFPKRRGFCTDVKQFLRQKKRTTKNCLGSKKFAKITLSYGWVMSSGRTSSSNSFSVK